MPPGNTGHRAGPPPDPHALRRERASDAATWEHLPASGRTGPVPEWPLSRASARERRLWEREWRRPQAIVWERHGQAEEVALYVRALVAAERSNASAAERSLVVRLMDSLGISANGLARNRWIIGEAPVARQRASTGEVVDIRERFRAVNG